MACSEDWFTKPGFIKEPGEATPEAICLRDLIHPGINRRSLTPTLSAKQRVVSALAKSDSLRSTRIDCPVVI